MDDKTLATCELLIRNRDRVKKVFHMDYAATYLGCANIYTMKDEEVDVDELKRCKSMIKDRVSIINNFRSYGFSTIAAMVAASDNPEATLDGGLQMYKLLKELFFRSEYLPFAAMIIGQAADPNDFQDLASKTRNIYDRMKSEHLFRTGSDDAGLCALLALSDKSVDTLVQNAETCFQTLKPEFFSGDAVQSLSYVLALSDASPQEACEKTMQMYAKLKDAGHKYGTYYELPSLGVLALTNANFDEIVQTMLEIDAWLSKQKGFGMMSSISKKQRLMYAGTIAQKSYVADNEALQGTTLTATMSLIIAQMMAIYAAICASMIASSIAAGSN